MENKKAALNEELLDKVSGGCNDLADPDDYYYCERSPILVHVWESVETEPGVLKMCCRWCGNYYY
jgi:hypothetical protein